MSVIITIAKPIIKDHLEKELAVAGFNTTIIWAYDNSWFNVVYSNDTTGVTAIYNAHTGLPYPSELRQATAIPNAGKVSELKGISISQAKTWIVRKLHGNDTETSLDTMIDSAVTVADLRPILKNIIATSYKRTETDKIILALLISLADQIMPNR